MVTAFAKKILKAIALIFVIIKLLGDNQLRGIAIVIITRTILKPLFLLTIIFVFVALLACKAEADDYWTETYEDAKEDYLEDDWDKDETDWSLDYECLRFLRGWSVHRPSGCDETLRALHSGHQRQVPEEGDGGSVQEGGEEND